MRQAEYFAAVYAILENENGEILFLRRANTSFMTGKLWLPSGHLEWQESLKQWTIREIKEEIGIDVQEEDLELVHSSHRITAWDSVYFDFYYKVLNYSWEIQNWEPEKCSELKFVSPDDSDVIPYLKEVLERIARGETFSEIYID